MTDSDKYWVKVDKSCIICSKLSFSQVLLQNLSKNEVKHDILLNANNLVCANKRYCEHAYYFQAYALNGSHR